MIGRSSRIALVCAAVSCSGVPTPSTSTYVATAGEGDLAEWSITNAGGSFSVNMTSVDSAGQPVDGGTYTFGGTCGSKNALYDYRICTVATVTPSRPDAGFPQPSDNIFILELPGVAVIAAPISSAQSESKTHVGLARGACGDFSGTYSYARVGPPGFIPNLIGQFTLVGNAAGEVLSSDAWEYGLIVNGQASTGSNADPIRVVLLTDPATAHPTALDAGATSCANGVVSARETVTVSVDGGGTAEKTATIRANVTSAGALLIDFPYHLGGAVGIRTTAAASLGDLLGKSFVVLTSTPDGGGDLLNVTVDGDAGVTINSALLTTGGPWPVGKVVSLSNPAVDAYFGAASILDAYSQIPGTSSWATISGARALAPAPATFAGFFAIVDNQNRLGTVENIGEADIFLAQKSSNGIFLVGNQAAVNRPGNLSCILAYGYQLYCVAGPFIGFSR